MIPVILAISTDRDWILIHPSLSSLTLIPLHFVSATVTAKARDMLTSASCDFLALNVCCVSFLDGPLQLVTQ